MGVYTGIPCCASQVLTISVGDVLSCLGVSETFGEAKVDYVHVVLLLANSNQKVVWLDVSVEEVARVYELNSLKLYKVENSRLVKDFNCRLLKF